MGALLADPGLLWYVSRSTGVVCLMLLTATTALGLASSGRVRTPWPRFVTQSLHRTLSLLAVLLLAGHIVAVVVDGSVGIRIVEALVPFIGTYRPLWLGLGAIAADLVLLVVVTSLVRTRLPHALWRGVHLTAYALWPVSMLHALGTGSDPRQAWFTVLALVCAAVVAGTLLWRLTVATARPLVLRIAGAVVIAAALAGIAGWAENGPMRPGWGAGADTPAPVPVPVAVEVGG
ncbi:MAG: ferric reductase-like transmembrane domain-containing protein [Pseudonocardia sp.]